MHTIPCLRCETPFERKRRGPVVHYCRPCRVKRKREYDREYRRQDHMTTGLPARLPDETTVRLDELRGVLGIAADAALILTHDRMPPGSKSSAGPDDGRSTHFEDLANELDTLSAASSEHPWWSSNPHWCLDL